VRILVTNDDGIDSEGIQVLAAALATTEHEVIVVAPDRNWSGAGAALGVLEPDTALSVERVRIDAAPHLAAWALAGPPALTVVAARLGAFGEPPDLVVSGINAGLNTGRSILHSGTVGAVLAGQNFGISGLAVSVADSDPWHWDAAAQLAVEVLPIVIDAPPRSAVNLNVPARPRVEIAGVRWARLATFGAVRASMAAVGDRSLQFELIPTGVQPDADTDQGTVQAGWASITSLVGVVEAWPGASATGPVGEPAELEGRIVPGAALHPTHRLATDGGHRLVRPNPGGMP
jgi:5'-nucleotidase